jgi:uncharacterized membrane protein YgaE (UPF0421/DUF939 family)
MLSEADVGHSHHPGNRGTDAMLDHGKAAKRPVWDYVHALNMAVACLIAYLMMAYGLSHIVDRDSDLLGGMWAAVAAIFVFRETRLDSLSAGLARLIATSVSFALCLPYLWFFHFTPVGMAALLAVGTLAMSWLGRRDDIITTAITTTVVMVVAAISPEGGWRQPLLRLADTVVGVGVGVSCKWIASLLYYRIIKEKPR